MKGLTRAEREWLEACAHPCDPENNDVVAPDFDVDLVARLCFRGLLRLPEPCPACGMGHTEVTALGHLMLQATAPRPRRRTRRATS